MRISNEAGIPDHSPVYFFPVSQNLKVLAGEYDDLGHLEQALGYSPGKEDPFHGLVAVALDQWRRFEIDALSVIGDTEAGYQLAYRTNKNGSSSYVPVARLELL